MNTFLVRLIIACTVFSSFAFAEAKAEFKRILALSPTDHIILDVAVSVGDVTIVSSHAGEISIAAIARTIGGKDLPANFFDAALTIVRDGSHVKIRSVPIPAYPERSLKISYTIEVPNWIEINSHVEDGKQVIAGVMGPVKVISERGDIKVSYVTTTLEARTGNGNITVIRVGSAARVETGAGNINLKDIGPASSAAVIKGAGRIEMDGVSGSFKGSTDAGELDAQGGIFGDWELNSVSGDICVGIATESKFEINASARSGRLLIENEDLEEKQEANLNEIHQKVNGGGKLVRVSSDSGNILIH